MGKEGFLACTQGVTREMKSQGFSKTLFSGESMFIYHVNGQGILWLMSFGAVDRLDVSPNSIKPMTPQLFRLKSRAFSHDFLKLYDLIQIKLP